MSFLNIADPRKRDALVKEYLAVKEKIKNRNLAERANNFIYHESLKESLEPVVCSTAASTEAITKELVPIKEGITALNTKLQTSKSEPTTSPVVKTEPKDEEGEEEEEIKEEPEENVFERIMEFATIDKLDPYFGIVTTEDGQYKMGNKIVNINGNDIIVEGTRYKGTYGLWTLIMFKRPDESLYDWEDMDAYEKLVYQTNVISSPNNLRSNSKINATYKMRYIFKQFENYEKFSKGEGIDFLPSDINSLQAKLAYLLGEYRAGNTSATRNEIVAIADNLLNRKHISKAEYKRINNFL